MYPRASAALAAQPHPVQFNLCIWGAANVWQWGSRVVGGVSCSGIPWTDTSMEGSLMAHVWRFERKLVVHHLDYQY